MTAEGPAEPRRPPGRLRVPLLARVVIALVLVGLVPPAVGLYQLRTQKDALLEQVQRTHIVAATAAAERVDAFVRPWLDLARTLAAHPGLREAPGSASSQDLLRGLLATRAELASLGFFDAAGEVVILARRPGLADVLPAETARRQTSAPSGPGPSGPGQSGPARNAPEVSLLRAGGRPWMRVSVPVVSVPAESVPVEGEDEAASGRLVLVVLAEELGPAVRAEELGDQAFLVLAGREGGVLVGDADALSSFPPAAVELAAAGKVRSGCSVYRDVRVPTETGAGDPQELVVAHATVGSAPWFVLSRQPATVADEARRSLRRAAWLSGAMALGLTLLLAAVAWGTAIRPLRRLASAQRALVGGAAAGSEIADLEQTFEVLRQRIHDHEDLGQVFIGRYQVTELVGSGAMGSVFRGWDAKLRRPVALKTVHLDAEAVDHRKLLQGLREEAAITSRIHQPNIVTVYDIEEQGHVAFLAMEFVDGVDLQTLINRRGALEEKATIPLAAEIARGLAAAHGHGLVHHDVKPGNILLGTGGEVKLTDFGVSQLISASTRAKDVICGTPGYLAPECFEGGEYGPEADLWAFGVLVYQCLTGRQPFRGHDLRATITQTLRYEPDRLDALFPGIDPNFADLVHRLMHKDLAHRPGSAAEVRDLLDELVQRRQLVWRPDVSGLVKSLVESDRPRRRTTLQEGVTSLFSTEIGGAKSL